MTILDETTKKCPKCGTVLPEDADFCPCCASGVGRRAAVKPPGPLLRPLLLLILLLLLLAALVGAGWRYLQPRTLEGTAAVTYRDRDSAYVLTLSWINTPDLPTETFHQTSEEGDNFMRFPIAFFVADAETGEEAGSAFLEKVESVTAGFLPWEDGPAPAECTVPEEERDYVAEAALVTFIDFQGREGTSELVWTFRMKNGDTIRLHTNVEVETVKTYRYYPEDVPMETAEDVQALVERIALEMAEDGGEVGIVYIYLPPVTYEGGLTLDWLPIYLVGNTEGEGRTVFRGPIRVSPSYVYGVSYLWDIDIVGDGTGTGVASSERLHLNGCRVSGWETGLLAYGSAWININDCVVEDNAVGMHFNIAGDNVSHTLFYDNMFRNNGTGLLLENVPTNMTLDFGGTVFSGNGVDIDNRCHQPLDVSEAVFE